MKIFLIVVGVVALALFAFTRLVEPPHQLDIINVLVPGDSGVARVAEGVVFDSASGLKLDVWAPSAPSIAKRPVLIFFYGGGWHAGERAHYGFVAKAYAAKGFVVVMPDYRKVPQAHFPVFNQDGAMAARWVQDKIATYGGDPARVTMSGHSAGAYIAMILTLDTHYLRDAGVAPGFVRATVGLSGPYDFLPLDSINSIRAFRGWPNLKQTQPINYVTATAPPIMVVTGSEDSTVKPRNAILMSQKLHRLGVRSEFKAYPGLGHEDIAMALSKVFRGKAPVLEDTSLFLMENSRAN